jgi:glycosyltransferase involved in cell wall biosynthesis
MEIISGLGLDGAIGHCFLLTRELVRRGHQLTVVCRPGSRISRQLASENVEIIFSDLHRWPTSELRRVAAICRDREIDVIQTHMSRAHGFGVLLRWLSGVPCVATAQNRYIQAHWMFNDYVIACSESTKRFHHRYNLVRKKRIATVHNFIDYDRFANVAKSARQKIRNQFGVGDEDLLIGQVGHVCPRKGQLHLVRAIPAVLTRFPQAWFLLVGCQRTYPAYVEKVKRETRRLGVDHRVIWAGVRTNIPQILTALDVFVLASLEEVHPLAILEAMVREVPVVATAVGGVPETVKTGETGILVPPADSPALAAATVQLLGDPDLGRRLGARGHEMVKRDYSPASQVRKIEAVLLHAAARGSPHVKRRAAA